MNAQANLGTSALAARLRREIAGQVLFGAADRGRYATDASIYQVMPTGVIIPERLEDVIAAMTICREAGISILARGGGTSQCGQTVNSGLVIDCSKHLRQLISVDAAAQRAWVQPGMVLGHLNAALKAHGLFFPVDPSTHARCTIGGMAGNNSCGSKSIRYGLMADNVSAIDAILANGAQHRFAAPGPNAADPRIAALLADMQALGLAEATAALLRQAGGASTIA